MQATEAPLTGRQKAAILCLALGVEHAAKLTQRLAPDEVEAISCEIARLDRVPPDLADAVLREWIETTIANETMPSGGVDYARDVLEKAFGAQKSEVVLDRVATQLADTKGLSRLRSADPQSLANTFRNEHPQTIALILAHLAPAQTAAILREFQPDLRADVTLRVARMEKVSPEMLLLIEKSLDSEGDLEVRRGLSRAGGPASIAAILNLVQGSMEQEILDTLATRDAGLAAEIKNLMFVFEDFIAVDDRALQRLLRDVEGKSLALALKGASAELKERITSQMSQRAVGALTEEMEMMGPVRMKDVEAAQAGIITQARALEEAGEIVLKGGDDLVA